MGLAAAVLARKGDVDDYGDLRELSRNLGRYPGLSSDTVEMVRKAAGS